MAARLLSILAFAALVMQGSCQYPQQGGYPQQGYGGMPQQGIQQMQPAQFGAQPGAGYGEPQQMLHTYKKIPLGGMPEQGMGVGGAYGGAQNTQPGVQYGGGGGFGTAASPFAMPHQEHHHEEGPCGPKCQAYKASGNHAHHDKAHPDYSGFNFPPLPEGSKFRESRNQNASAVRMKYYYMKQHWELKNKGMVWQEPAPPAVLIKWPNVLRERYDDTHGKHILQKPRGRKMMM